MEANRSDALTGQQVVIVGGTSGMGLGAAHAALQAGASVVVAGRRPLAKRVGFDVEKDRVRHALVDVADEGSVRALFDDVGAIDHLFVTAAPAPGSWKPFLQGDLQTMRRYLDEKLFGSLASARYAAPHLRPGGSITFLTGVAAIRPRSGATMVTVAFAALEAASRALALELAPVRVNTIRPGLVDSDMWAFLDVDARERLRQKARDVFPARRIGTVEDIGQAAVFLMTNPYVTGSVLEVSGGESLVDAF
jgi:NAD(P)-dependent dehydrogenase (short-subunit alcohol dehydrogenase family)